MKTLVDHARDELDRAGVEPTTAAVLVAVVGAFTSLQAGPDKRRRMLYLLSDLIERLPLTDLTANPAEWQDMSAVSGVPMWQSTRDPRAFSDDGGRTYSYSRDDGSDDPQTFRSVAPTGWVRALRERDGVDVGEAEAAIWAYLDAGPISRLDIFHLDDATDAARVRYLERRWGPVGSRVATLMYDWMPAALPPARNSGGMAA